MTNRVLRYLDNWPGLPVPSVPNAAPSRQPIPVGDLTPHARGIYRRPGQIGDLTVIRLTVFSCAGRLLTLTFVPEDLEEQTIARLYDDLARWCPEDHAGPCPLAAIEEDDEEDDDGDGEDWKAGAHA